MDWFEKLTGFREAGYEETRARLEVEDGRLRSRINGASYEIGELELVSLQALRERAKSGGNLPGRVKTSVVTGDVRRMHRSSENAGALFQVASQFNLLEMVSPDVTPEHGVTRYQSDRTQGPACAIAAGAATIYRNYFVPIEGSQGQTATRQLDGLADLGAALSSSDEFACRRSMDDAERLRIGYPNGTRCHRSTSPNACTRPDRCLARKTTHRSTSRCRSHRSSGPGSAAGLSSHSARHFQSPTVVCRLLIGSHSRCLSLRPHTKPPCGRPLLNAQRGASNVVFLTLLGGGAFGNHGSWIYAAMRRALELMTTFDLDVRLVSYGTPSKEIVAIAEEFR